MWFLWLICLLLPIIDAAEVEKSPAKPNIIFILADDLVSLITINLIHILTQYFNIFTILGLQRCGIPWLGRDSHA